MKHRLRLLSLTCLFVFGCTSTPKKATRSINDTKVLTQEAAERRFSQVRNVEYDMAFYLSKGPTYKGTVTVSFDFQKLGYPLRFDFRGTRVSSVFVNGKPTVVNHDGRAFFLDEKYLQQGPNNVQVEFDNKYSGSGHGLVRFQDPKDGRVYLYSNLEPFDGNRVFPMFDQPDLKARYTMTVRAPRNWKVVTSVFETQIKNHNDYTRTWIFPKSQKFSTYIWSLHAGPYYMWQSKAGKVPLRLFTRQSLATYVKPKHWFDDTRKGLQFFNGYFAYDYPYKKYDQLIVPAFPAGAMENVGAVTFNEYFVVKGKKSEEIRRDLRDVIYHEMAHMWFGNLVTMKWWDGLWLNESFATFMAAYASYKITGDDKHWRDYDGGRKNSTYIADQKSTTHPIQSVILDTDEAFANFDRITYGKGAAFLKLLNFYVGEETFQLAMQDYFKAFAEKNTVIDHFVSALSKRSDKKLNLWFKEWLETQGLTTFQAQWTCQPNGRIQNFTIEQRALGPKVILKTQKTKLALFYKNSRKKLFPKKVLNVMVSGPSTKVPELTGENCPEFVTPNYQEMAYAKVILDPTSVKEVRRSMSHIADTRTREQLANVLWEMVRDGQLSAKTFADIALSAIETEKDPSILTIALNHVHGKWSTSQSVLRFAPKDPQNKAEFLALAERVDKAIWKRLEKAKPGSEVQRKLYDSLNKSSKSSFGVEKITGILDKKIKLKGFKLTSRQKWASIIRLCSAGWKGSLERALKEKNKENTDEAQTYYLSCRSSAPDSKIKRELIAEVLNNKSSLSIHNKKYVLWSLFQVDQEQIRKDLTLSFENDIDQALGDLSSDLIGYLSALAPSTCEEDQRDRVINYIDSRGNRLPARLVKSLKERVDSGRICQQARKAF